MKKLLAILILVLIIIALAGCGSFSTTKPAIVYQPQEVKVAVPTLPPKLNLDGFQSEVLNLKDNSSDGEVGRAYKLDWLTLMYRDKLFTDYIYNYNTLKDKLDEVNQKSSK